jgi:hypothetical protein
MDPRQFAVVPEHFIGDIERIVYENDRFAVVAKREGVPADVARDENARGYGRYPQRRSHRESVSRIEIVKPAARTDVSVVRLSDRALHATPTSLARGWFHPLAPVFVNVSGRPLSRACPNTRIVRE